MPLAHGGLVAKRPGGEGSADQRKPEEATSVLSASVPGLCVILSEAEGSPRSDALLRPPPRTAMERARTENQKKEHRFALREYSGQAPVVRLQQLPLRMTDCNSERSEGSANRPTTEAALGHWVEGSTLALWPRKFRGELFTLIPAKDVWHSSLRYRCHMLNQSGPQITWN